MLRWALAFFIVALVAAVFGFLGVTDLQVVRAEGLNIDPSQRQAIIESHVEHCE